MQIKTKYRLDGKVRIPEGYEKLLCGTRIQKGDYYLEKKYSFIPLYKYNEKYPMPRTENDNDFLTLLYKNCLLIEGNELTNRYNGPFSYWIEQLALRRNSVVTPATDSQTTLPIIQEELPGISREELYKMFIDKAHEQNQNPVLDEKREVIFWKPSLGRGDVVTSWAVYIRRKPRVTENVNNEGVKPELNNNSSPEKTPVVESAPASAEIPQFF